MKFEDSIYYSSLKHRLIELPFGKFYLFDHFIISEINSEVHFDWKKIEKLIYLLVEHYGENIKIAYISNRVNLYSFDPYLWIKFEKDYGFIVASAMVCYDERNKMNASLEKHISNNSIKRCWNLNKAIEWVQNLKEFN